MRPHPNAGNAESASSAHGAGSRFASDRMLVQSVRAGQSRLSALPHLYVPVKGGMGACPHVYPRPLTFCARMPRRQNPPALPASPAILLPVIACSHRMCALGKASFLHFSMPSDGVWGFAPCLSPVLDLPRPKAENANTSGSAPPSHKVMGYGVNPQVYHRP